VALLVALGVLAVLGMFAALVANTVDATRARTALGRANHQRSIAAAAFLELAVGWSAPHEETVTLGAESGATARVAVRPLAPDDPVWPQIPGISRREGDRLATIDWADGARSDERYLINDSGRRPAAVRLPQAKVPAETTHP
jgi:hypothetical protein